ncbi:MAG TPA: DUF4038 domain-containing protein [Alloacidobacterium sp.]|jgi:hypothetical protein|nr:DUF4038 domain-containing protein [Alloacidobacterium sp.]
MLRILKSALSALIALVAVSPLISSASPADVSFSSAPSQVDRYDYVEIIASIRRPDAANPFEDASLTGVFETIDGTHRRQVEGFCDSADGSVFRIRFMAPEATEYKYTVTYKQGSFERTSQGTFQSVEAHRRGMIGIDPNYPWHFVWKGTGEHYFFNGTTAFFLMGWKDDRTIDFSIDRLHRLKINRIRVSLYGRENTFFGEPVMVGPNWNVNLAPWPGKNPDDYYHPGWDYSRFNVPYWQKFERMLKFARQRDMVISVIFDMGDSYVHPGAGSEDEHRYIRYALARFGAFSNITWDLGDDLDRYRDDKWTHETGMLLESWDPYKHLATSHPVHIVHQDRASSWFGFTSYQDWSRNQHALMLDSRKLQKKTGRIIPQTNEEYGYEDHYPLWAIPGSDSADILRRTAWDIVMAGGYQTAGESARRGTNIWPDMGGGWFNGRGDDTMTMFLGYGHMVDFFTSFDWWKTDPHDELVSRGDYCLADPGRTYAVYLPHGGSVTVQLQPGHYRASWFSAMTGETIDLPTVLGPIWTSPEAPDRNDWALLLRAF